jgi:hypothetical protein
VIGRAGLPKNRAPVLRDLPKNLLDPRYVLLQAEIIFGMTSRQGA